jgi:hypothetical protein
MLIINGVILQLMQQRLFCSCGCAPAVAGLCRPCYYARWPSELLFGGCRDRVLTRDAPSCRGCQTAAGVVVHHRAPGKNTTAQLITLCRPCHAGLHHRFQPSGWWPPLLVALWEEQHEGPRQLALGLASVEALARAA